MIGARQERAGNKNAKFLGVRHQGIFFSSNFFRLIASRSDLLVAVAGSLGIDLLPSGIDAFAGHASWHAAWLGDLERAGDHAWFATGLSCVIVCGHMSGRAGHHGFGDRCAACTAAA